MQSGGSFGPPDRGIPELTEVPPNMMSPDMVSGGMMSGEHQPPANSPQAKWPCSWDEFTGWCAAHLAPDGPLNTGHLRQVKGRCLPGELVLDVESQVVHTMFNTPTRLECLRRLATELAGCPVSVRLAEPSRVVIPEATLREEAKTHPAVRLMMEEFDASVHRCVMLDDNTVSHG